MGNVVRLATTSAPTTQRGCNVNENRRSGFVLLYKSVKDTPFYRDPMRKAMWLHLLLEVTHERTESVFNGNRVALSRGQLVGSARSLGEACGVSEDSARRSLDAFEREGMITRTSKVGTKGYTLITVINYDQYQRGISEHDGAEFGAEFKAAPDMGLQGVSQSDCAELGAEFHAEDLNNINNQTSNDLKDFSSQLADANFDQQSEQGTGDELVAAEPVTTGPASPRQKTRTIPGAAVQTPNGKAWGTDEDLKTAQWMFKRVLKLNPTAQEPNWPQWANVVRLMRELDKRTHREFCELYDWVSRDPFWCANVLSPQKLREKWDQLVTKRSVPAAKPVHLSNLMQAQKQAQALREQGVTYDRNTPL